MVSSDQRPVGTWFGPNAVAQAIKKMTVYDPQQRLQVYVAMNNALVISEVMSSSIPWQPLLLFIPVRLGIHEINPTYFDSLKVCTSISMYLTEISTSKLVKSIFFLSNWYEFVKNSSIVELKSTRDLCNNFI